jgi:hypothetical protein
MGKTCAAQASLGLPYLYTYAEADLPELHSHVDFVACLGGDGLILHASLLFKRAIPPIISFKLGSLGFLTCHEFRNFRRHLADVIQGYQVCLRRARGIRGGFGYCSLLDLVPRFAGLVVLWTGWLVVGLLGASRC